MSGLRHLRAPQQDQAILAEPPLSAIGDLLARNQQRFDSLPLDVLDRPLRDLRRSGRQIIVEAARAYLVAAGEPVPSVRSDSLILAGHQPELFHPGVWSKNFALQGLARRWQATPLNLVVDNDTAKSAALRLPELAPHDGPWPRTSSLPFDLWTGEIPYEERAVRDEVLFASLAESAAPVIEDWGYQPLLPKFWKRVCRQAARTPLLGERLVAGRRSIERDWGCHNLELPISRLCGEDPFAWFMSGLLVELPRFHAVYNEAVRSYRRLHRIRSRHHPVPELTREGDWLELPFWGWRAGGSGRGRLLARLLNDRVELRAGNERWLALPGGTPGHRQALVKAWQDLEPAGFKVRTRALTTTLFARLFLADLFLHGLGGGKYDEVTDDLIRRFYGIEPPAYAILTATLRLPLPTADPAHENCRDLAHELRDLHYNPQRYLSKEQQSIPALKSLVEVKQTWMRSAPGSTEERRRRYQELRRITGQLRQCVAGRERALERDLGICRHQLRANDLLRRRDYAFCLFPELVLRPFCTQFL